MVTNSLHEDFEIFLAYATKHQSRAYKLDFIEAFLQEKVKNRVFFKLYIRYTDYFPEYAKYFVRDLRLLNSMYGMTNSGNLLSGELIDWLLEAFLSNINVICISIISMHHMEQ